MTGMQDREKALENKYFHTEENKFKVISRRRKLLGLWAAELMGMNDDQALRYALEIVNYGIDHTEDGAVVHKIMEDINKNGGEITEKLVRKKMQEFEAIAYEKIVGGN